MKQVMIIILSIAAIAGCYEREIVMTHEYMINEHWNRRNDDRGGNQVEIEQLKVKRDSLINPFDEPGQTEILDRLEPDTSFNWSANFKVGELHGPNENQIFFNRDNGFSWFRRAGDQQARVIGALKRNSWYRVSGWSYYYHVIYIDSIYNVHRFVINQANY